MARPMTVRNLVLMVFGVAATAGVVAQQTPSPPDAIFFNGKVITVDRQFTIQQAFAVRSDAYVAVGTNEHVRALAGPATRMVDLRGSSVIPGLSDNHDHIYAAEKVMRGISLVGVTSTEEVVRRLREGVANARPGQTVFGSIGWRAPLVKADLDRISTTVSIVALRGRRGAALANTAALLKVGITNTVTQYRGKPLPRDEHGQLTGEMPAWPQGYLLMDELVPPPTPDEEDRMLIAGMQQRNALGITSVRDLANWPFGMRAFQRVWQQGTMTVRVSMGLDLPDEQDPASLLRLQGVAPGFGDKWLRVDSTGEEPWPPTTFAPDRYVQLAKEFNRLGWRPSPHVPSNESLDMVLDAYEAADRESPIRGRRWVIEHVPNATPAQMQRIATLGVVVSTQAAGYASNYDAAVKNLGRAQAERQTPVRDLLDAGIVVVAGSDYSGPNADTLTPNNPWLPISYYVTRTTRDGRVLGAGQRITRAEALRIATNNNAYVTFEENVKGSIEAGKLADFVVLSADYLTVPDAQILQLRAMATYVGGRRVYSAADSNGVF